MELSDDDLVVDAPPAVSDDNSTLSDIESISSDTTKDSRNDHDGNGDDEWDEYEQRMFFLSSADAFAKAPALQDWKEVDDFQPISVTVAKSKRTMWEQAQEEIRLIRKNIQSLIVPTDVTSNTSSSARKVYHVLFGSSSLLCMNFCNYLDMTKKDYLQFLFTFILSCKNQQSAAMLHASKEINTEMLMPLSIYNMYWAKIRDFEGNLKQPEFWKLIEEGINRQLKNLFLSDDLTFPYLIGYDDDKVHFCYSKETKMSGLSQQYHACDHRNGLTLHTGAFSATCVPIHVSFQRRGESVQDTYLRSMRELFGVGRGGLPLLRSVTLASDRGYWDKKLLFGQILEAGADIVGTMKRVS